MTGHCEACMAQLELILVRVARLSAKVAAVYQAHQPGADLAPLIREEASARHDLHFSTEQLAQHYRLCHVEAATERSPRPRMAGEEATCAPQGATAD